MELSFYNSISRAEWDHIAGNARKLFYSNATPLIFIPIKLIAEIKNFDIWNIPP